MAVKISAFPQFSRQQGSAPVAVPRGLRPMGGRPRPMPLPGPPAMAPRGAPRPKAGAAGLPAMPMLLPGGGPGKGTPIGSTVGAGELDLPGPLLAPAGCCCCCCCGWLLCVVLAFLESAISLLARPFWQNMLSRCIVTVCYPL